MKPSDIPTDVTVRCDMCGEGRVIHLSLNSLRCSLKSGQTYTSVDGVLRGNCHRCGQLRRTPSLLFDRVWLEAAYANGSTHSIAEGMGVDPKTVLNWLHRHGIHVRTRAENAVLRNATKAQKGTNRARQMVTAGRGVGQTGIGILNMPDAIHAR